MRGLLSILRDDGGWIVQAAQVAAAAYGAYKSSKGSSDAANLEASGQTATNAMLVREAQKSRDWSERMYKNQHQYEVEDLRKAGLNPILSAQRGATTFQGAVATGMQNPYAGRGQLALSNARELREQTLLKGQFDKLQAETRLINAQAKLAGQTVTPNTIGSWIGVLKGVIHGVSPLILWKIAFGAMRMTPQGRAGQLALLLSRNGVAKGKKAFSLANKILSKLGK